MKGKNVSHTEEEIVSDA